MNAEFPIRTAAAYQEITIAALEQAALDLRQVSYTNLGRKLAEVIGDNMPWGETVFEEQETFRQRGIYADDADWDDPDLEPIDYEMVPILVIRATRQFVDRLGVK